MESQTEEPAAAADEEAQIVTVVSGEPVDLRPVDAAAPQRDQGEATAVVDDEPVDTARSNAAPSQAARSDTAVEREPERDSVR